MSNVDQFHDAAFAVLHVQTSRMPALEDFIKTSSIDLEEADTLPNSAFAWPGARRFPLHTAEHAALSYAYSKVASDLPPFVIPAIEKALDIYGVPSSTFEEVKISSPQIEEKYLIPEKNLFRVTDAESLKTAQERVLNNFTKLDLESRAIACANLVKLADEHGVELHPAVLKFAGLVVSNTRQTRDWLSARAAALPKELETLKEAYETLGQGLAKAPVEVRDRAGLLKLASTIAELDEQAGLDKHYDRRIPDPLQTVFNTEKLSASSIDLGGVMVPAAKIAALPASFWEDLGGAELSNEIAPGGVVDPQKIAVVVDTLPLDLKTVLRQQLRV